LDDEIETKREVTRISHLSSHMKYLGRSSTEATNSLSHHTAAPVGLDFFFTYLHLLLLSKLVQE